MTRAGATLCSLVPALFFLVPGLPAAADPLPPTVSITLAEIAPLEAIASGGSFVLANDSPALARIEFDLKRGQGLSCSEAGKPARTARKFLVQRDSQLVCTAESGRRYGYTIFQSVRSDAGEFVQRREEGRIEVR